jgi:hypothetical protein
MTSQDFTFFKKSLTLHYYCLGKTVHECHAKYYECYDTLVPELDTIRMWFRKIKDGALLLTARQRTGRPKRADLGKIIREKLEQMPFASTKDLAAMLETSPHTIKNRLQLGLG